MKDWLYCVIYNLDGHIYHITENLGQWLQGPAINRQSIVNRLRSHWSLIDQHIL